LKPVPVEEMLFISKGGLPLYSLRYTTAEEQIDPALLSGYLQAIKQFSETYISKAQDSLQINYGEQIITLLKGEKVDLAIISNYWDELLVKIMRPILKEFEEEYYPHINPVENYLPDHYAFELKKKLITVLGNTYLKDSYIPLIINANHPYVRDSVIVSYIDGLTPINQILKQSELPKHVVYWELYFLWANEVITFNISISDYDIFLKTHNLISRFQPGTDDYQYAEENFKEIVNSIPVIISKLDGRHTVKEILEYFDIKLHEYVIDFLQYLLESHLIRKPSTYEMELILSIDIFERALEFAYEDLKPKEIMYALNEALNELKDNIISSSIKLHPSGRIEVNFDIANFLTLEDSRLEELADKWLQLLVLTFSYTDNKKKAKRTIEKLIEYINTLVIQKNFSEDISVIEKLSYYLETVFASQ